MTNRRSTASTASARCAVRSSAAQLQTASTVLNVQSSGITSRRQYAEHARQTRTSLYAVGSTKAILTDVSGKRISWV